MLTNDFSNYIDADDEEIKIEISNFNNSAKVLFFCNKLQQGLANYVFRGQIRLQLVFVLYFYLFKKIKRGV